MLSTRPIQPFVAVLEFAYRTVIRLSHSQRISFGRWKVAESLSTICDRDRLNYRGVNQFDAHYCLQALKARTLTRNGTAKALSLILISLSNKTIHVSFYLQRRLV